MTATTGIGQNNKLDLFSIILSTLNYAAFVMSRTYRTYEPHHGKTTIHRPLYASVFKIALQDFRSVLDIPTAENLAIVFVKAAASSSLRNKCQIVIV